MKRPDGIIKIPLDAITSETVAYDISVTSTMSVSSTGKLRHKGKLGSAADQVYNEKMRKYNALCAAQGVKFVPIVFETSGYVHPESKKFLNHLASIGQNTRKIGQKTLYSYFIKILSTCLMSHLADNIARLSNNSGNYAFPLHLEQMYMVDDAIATHNTVITGVDLLAG